MKSLILISITSFLIMGLSSCKKELVKRVAVLTDSIYLTDSGFIATGSLLDFGNGILEFGHCWSKNPKVSLSDYKSTAISELNGFYQSSIANLEDSANYYVCSYVIGKDNDIAYGNVIELLNGSFNLSAPEVYLKNSDTIKVRGYINIVGDYRISKHGFCWSSSNEYPTIYDSYSEDDTISSSKEIIYFIDNFESNTIYYLRGYAVVNNVITYSRVTSFKTGNMTFSHDFETVQSIEEDFLLTSYIVNDWDESTVISGYNGNGLFINHDMGEGWNNDGANFFALESKTIDLSINRGSIEFRFTFKFNADSCNEAYFFNTGNSITDHFESDAFQDKGYIKAGWYGYKNSFANADKNFFFTIGNKADNTELTVCPDKNKTYIADLLNFKINSEYYFKFVWDIGGIYDGEETMHIYINGLKVAGIKEKWGTTDEIDPYFYLGTTPGYDRRDHYFNAVKGVYDDLKIFDFANINN